MRKNTLGFTPVPERRVRHANGVWDTTWGIPLWRYGVSPREDLHGLRLRALARGGFTYIEMLVVGAIVLVAFGLGLASYNEFNRRQIVIQAAQNLESDLRLAQGKALGAEKTCLGAYLGHRVQVFGDAYALYSQCDGSEGPQTWRQLPAKVTVWADPAFTGFLFEPLGSGVDQPGEVYLLGYGVAVGITVRKIEVQTAGSITVAEVEKGDIPGNFEELPPTEGVTEPTPTPTHDPFPPSPTPTEECCP